MTMRKRSVAADTWMYPLAIIVALSVIVTAEIQKFNISLPATSTSIQYTELYLRGPGSVDVSGLILTATSDTHKSYFPPAIQTDDDYHGDDGAAGDDGDDNAPGAANADDKNEDDDNAEGDDGVDVDDVVEGDDKTDTKTAPALPQKAPSRPKAKAPAPPPAPATARAVSPAPTPTTATDSKTARATNTPTQLPTTSTTTSIGDDGDDADDGDSERRMKKLAASTDVTKIGASLRWRQLMESSSASVSTVTAAKYIQSSNAQRNLDDSGRTFVDFVAFKLPSDCANTKAGCDWPSLGIGAQLPDGTLRWCCSSDAVALGLCKGGADLGRLIVDQGKLPGKKRQIPIPNSGEIAKSVNNGLIDAEESGNYVLIMANCDDQGRDLLLTGEAAYKSVHGFLPGELWGFLYFFGAMTIAYLVVSLWYSIMMHLNFESRIPIEKWILTTILLGLGEMVFKTADAFVWNSDGHRHIWICYMGIVLGVVKRGWSRSLIVMVSLGWGVTRDTLGRKYKWIFMLCMLYIGLSAFCDLTFVVANTAMETLSQNVESNLYDIYTLLTFTIAAVDVVYVMWIMDALASTMEHLESQQQTRKLKRYLRLRCLFLFAVLFAAAWAIFAVANAFTDGIVGEEDAWMVDSATELNYLIVMLGIACLWRPSPTAKEYAYAMELPSSNYEGDGSELELSGAGVPSALDSDDEYDDGYVDTKQGRNVAFKDDEPNLRHIT
ncbi:hypothetical protein MPSEU_000512500 [Mayamaea pseudoterrestris]|nr:hypothetical protein MPSEU_000512500 [Mayamaea pseudoterrestris]